MRDYKSILYTDDYSTRETSLQYHFKKSRKFWPEFAKKLETFDNEYRPNYQI